MGWYDRKIRQVRDLSCGEMRILLELEVRRIDCRSCGKVKQERLDFLADNPFYTKRFAYFVGRRCRQASISDVAKELALDWHTAIHEGAARTRGHAGSAGDRDRRDCDPQGSYLSDRGQRSCAAPADLVWRRGPIGSEHGAVLRLARQAEERTCSPCSDGHVEAVSGGDGRACAESRDFIRQVPHHASSRRGA